MNDSPENSLPRTPKQEAFCLAYVETGNASEAFRRAYNAENMSENAIQVAASRLLANAKIALRIEELQAGHQKRHAVTVDSLTKELEADRTLARNNDHSSAAISKAQDLALECVRKNYKGC